MLFSVPIVHPVSVVRHSNVRLRKILAFEQQWGPAVLGKRVSKTITEIKPRRMSSPTKTLESLTRVWASKYHTVYVTSGAIFDRNGDSIRDDDSDAVRMKSNSGKKRVAVPSQYYKVILRKDQDGFHSIAFSLDHTKTAHGVKWADVRPDVEDAITTIEEIEDKSDLKLFPDLDRDEIAQSPDGEGWALDKSASNLEAGCP